jgi:hypothetical protein
MTRGTGVNTMVCHRIFDYFLYINHNGRVDGKGRVAEWLQAQPSDTSELGLTWSVVTTGPYMQMLFNVSSS